MFGFYREHCERAQALLDTTALSTPPRGQVLPGMAAEIFDLRGIVLHMIEEYITTLFEQVSGFSRTPCSPA